MYHSHIDSQVKSAVQESFASDDGIMSAVFYTIKFGRGVNVQNM